MTKNNKQVVVRTKTTKNGKTTKKEETFIENRNRLYKERGGLYGAGPAQYAGHAIGGLLGGPAGFVLGGAVGHAAGYFTGTGDYTLNNFKQISSNACTVPGFGKGNNDSVIVTHREFIQDVVGTSAFTATTFALNPGQTTSFPWLAQIACNYEEYEILGMVYNYVSTSGNSVGSTNTALGTIIMATEYDPTKPVFTSKQAMENYSFATSSRPADSFMHAIECKKSRTPVKELYVRTGSNTGTDLRWTDFGNFTLATIGNPLVGATLGELWCTYKVKLIKPRLPITLGFAGQIASARVARTGSVSASPLGTATATSKGPLALTVTGTTISWFAEPLAQYAVFVAISAATSSTILVQGTPVGLTNTNDFASGVNSSFSLGGGAGAANFFCFQCSNTSAGQIVSAVFNANTIVGAATTDILVMQLDSTVTGGA